MIEPRGGPTLIELDARASEPFKPYGIITADCSGAHELDDGIAVTPLPMAEDLYRVSVFAVDTSPLYHDETIMRRVLQLTESKYHDMHTGYEGYAPMLDDEITQQLHFGKRGDGDIRKALVISFMIGGSQPATDVEIGFGRVEVKRNYVYNTFGGMCKENAALEHYGRAAACIIKHLGTEYTADEEIYRSMVEVPRTAAFRRGANINQAFMVGANHLVARTMRDEGRLAIYRAFDSHTSELAEVLSPSIARYTTIPSPHGGLGLDVYTRVTSPLRRAEDFIMHGLLRARAKGRPINLSDQRRVATAVRRLNQRVAAEQFSGRPRLDDDILPHFDTPPESLSQTA